MRGGHGGCNTPGPRPLPLSNATQGPKGDTVDSMEAKFKFFEKEMGAKVTALETSACS